MLRGKTNRDGENMIPELTMTRKPIGDCPETFSGFARGIKPFTVEDNLEQRLLYGKILILAKSLSN